MTVCIWPIPKQAMIIHETPTDGSVMTACIWPIPKHGNTVDIGYSRIEGTAFFILYPN